MLLRVVHGVVVTHGTIISARFLMSFLTDLPRVLARHPSFLVLYGGLTIANLFIAWSAWRRFGARSLPRSVISYGVWLVFFVWHGWFVDWAPFRLDADYIMWPREEAVKYVEISIGICCYLCGYALFPILCYVDKRRQDARQESTGTADKADPGGPTSH
jgi:hypothetical protein